VKSCTRRLTYQSRIGPLCQAKLITEDLNAGHAGDRAAVREGTRRVAAPRSRHGAAAPPAGAARLDQIDLVDEMFTLTTTIALRALFSSQLDPAQAERLRRAFDTFLRGIWFPEPSRFTCRPADFPAHTHR
jgi:hypothetical protein